MQNLDKKSAAIQSLVVTLVREESPTHPLNDWQLFDAAQKRLPFSITAKEVRLARILLRVPHNLNRVGWDSSRLPTIDFPSELDPPVESPVIAEKGRPARVNHQLFVRAYQKVG